MRPRPHRSLAVVAVAVAVALLLGAALPLTASAADEPPDLSTLLGIAVRNRVELGREKPAVLITPQRPLKFIELSVKPSSGGREQTVRRDAVPKGRLTALEFDQREGTATWTATLAGKWKDGKDFSVSFDFETAALSPLAIDLEKKDVDVPRSRLTMRLSRPADKVEYVVIGDGGRELDRGARDIGGKPTIDLAWRAPAGATIEVIRVKAWDQAGFWAGVEIMPFEVHIPHDEVEFEFGHADIRPAEEHKLTATLGQLQEAIAKHGKEIEIQLYIAGYTDTVGSKSANLDLSEQRARSIAAWFRKKGVSAPIYYQGFGEDVLAVATPDETREARNRRAIYVLSAGPPGTSDVIPRANWKRL
jgi:outer membrane protein OmpA-like peptidoglycan-associated protein